MAKIIGIHVESIILGAGEDMELQIHLSIYETLMNDVEIEAKYHGSMELGREIEIFMMVSYKRNKISYALNYNQ